MIPVVFDLDGTLIDSLGGITSAANATLADWNLPPVGEDVTVGFVGRGERIFVERLIAATALVRDDADAILERFIHHYRIAAEDTPLMPGVRAALDALRREGHPLGLVTNKPRAPLGATLRSAGLSSDFEVILAGDDLERRKPDPLPLLEAMRRMDATACVYVGDSDIDAATAEAAGQPFLLYTEGIRTAPVEKIPHRAAFRDFGDLLRLVQGVGA